MPAAEGQTIASITLKTLHLLRSDESFKLFWTRIQMIWDEPSLPQRRKVPRRYNVGDSDGDFPLGMLLTNIL